MRPWRKPPPSDDPRERLLERLRPHVSDARVLEAIRAVPRDRFVPARRAEQAWDNVALPIGSGQTISQPLVVARMCELLELSGEDRVLDVGTGSGYHAAVLARLVRHVWTIERHPGLSERAEASLAAAGVRTSRSLVGDGALGYPAARPTTRSTSRRRWGGCRSAGRPARRPAGGWWPGRRRRPAAGPPAPAAGGELERSAHERVRFVPLISGPG